MKSNKSKDEQRAIEAKAEKAIGEWLSGGFDPPPYPESRAQVAAIKQWVDKRRDRGEAYEIDPYTGEIV